MLETLLKHFRSYGMNDLEFIIVNSKLSHSQDKLPELQKRVSFGVYQETDEEEVWSVMEGGKDDMYVYDRCGRLTYYIPFPLSILNESPLVSNAILATYFRSPCGVMCDNETLGIDEIVKNIDGDYETENGTEQENSTYSVTDQSIYDNETTNNNQFPNEIFGVTVEEFNEMDIINSNSTQNITEYDYPTYDNNLQMNETNTTDTQQAQSFFNSIYRLFFNAKNEDDKVTDELNFNTNLNRTSDHEGDFQMSQNETTNELPSIPVHHFNHDHHKHAHRGDTDDHVNKKSDRCLEADYEVCKNWSKKRLLHAQKCCSEIHSSSANSYLRSCVHFGKKRCKKMQSILKCCIKTVYTEPTATKSTDEPMTTTEELLTTVHESIAEEPEGVTTDGLVCCKTTNHAKLCRMSYSGTCDDDEYIEHSPSEDM